MFASFIVNSQADVVISNSFDNLADWNFDSGGANHNIDSGFGLNYINGSISISGGTSSYKLSAGLNNNNSVNYLTFEEQSGDIFFRFLVQNTDRFLQVYLTQYDTSDNSVTQHNSAGAIIDDRTNGVDFDIMGRLSDSDSTKNSSNLYLGGNEGHDDTFLLVGKLHKDSSSNYNRLSVALNPDDSNSINWQTITQNIEIESVDTLAIRAYSAFNNTDSVTAESYIDELVIGTTLGDVLAVPEPSTYALIIGLAGFTYVLLSRSRI